MIPTVLKFLKKAWRGDEVVRLQVMSVIHKALEESLTNGTNENAVALIIDNGIAPLYWCFQGNSPQPSLVPSARVLEIVAEQCPEETYDSEFFIDLLRWLERLAEFDDQVITQMASIFKCLAAEIPSDEREDKLVRILPLLESNNLHIVVQAAIAAHNLIKTLDQIPDNIKVEHIQIIVQFVVDGLDFFYQFVIKGKTSDKVTMKILSALKMLLLNPTKHGEVTVKQINKYRSEIEQFNTGSGTIAANIISLLEKRIELQRYTIVPTTTAAGPRISDIFDTEIKKGLEYTVELQLLYPDLCKSFSTPPIAVLLFGEPGTGKETLAKAVANEAGATLFSLPASAIIAKEENDAIEFIKMLFQMAKNVQPSAIIFIDDLDELLGHGTETHGPLRYATKQRARAEFLVQMDNCCSPSSSSTLSSSTANDCCHRVLVIGATNQPWELNDNTLRHFAKRIYVEMPDKVARAKMLQKIVNEKPMDFKLSESDVDKLADMTENFSFNHLRAFCQEASLDALRSSRTNVVHSHPSIITMRNFEKVHQNIKPFLSEGNAKKLEEFAKTHHFAKRQKILKK